MNANRLFAEFLGILIYHLLAALLFDITVGFGLTFLLLHSKEAHLTFVEPLLSVLDRSNICFQGSQLFQVLSPPLLQKLGTRLVNWVSIP